MHVPIWQNAGRQTSQINYEIQITWYKKPRLTVEKAVRELVSESAKEWHILTVYDEYNHNFYICAFKREWFHAHNEYLIM
jgi:hypothetical protein